MEKQNKKNGSTCSLPVQWKKKMHTPQIPLERVKVP
jgi:hypothetical protein